MIGGFSTLQKMMQEEIALKLGDEEILSMLSEECSELAQAAQKMLRVINGTTPVRIDKALSKLNEETGDVLLLIDYLSEMGFIDIDCAFESAKRKNIRWYNRVFGGEK